jgi:PmbA protein
MSAKIGAEHLLDEASNSVEEAELYEVHRSRLPVSFSGGSLESVKALNTMGRALRVIDEGHIGFSTTTDVADSQTLIQNASQAASFGDPVPFQFPDSHPEKIVECFDPQVVELDADTLIALGEAVIERIKEYDPGLNVEVSLERSVDRVRLLNTMGLNLQEQRTSFQIVVQAIRAVEGDIQIMYDIASSRRAEDVDGLAVADKVVQRLRWAETPARVTSSTLPVVFKGMGVLPLLLPLMYGLSGRSVYMGSSPLGERLGEQVFDPRITLVDDGRLDFAGRTGSFDDEGIPTRTKVLIEDGVVRQFLYDLKTAGRTGEQTTGNGFKAGLFGGGFQQLPNVSPSTWVLAPGDRSVEEILGELDEALLVEQVIGLGQGNVMAGEFSNNVSVGFLMRRGELVGRVKNTMIAGNVYELLKDNLIALGRRPEWVYGVLSAPAIVVEGVGIATQT